MSGGAHARNVHWVSSQLGNPQSLADQPVMNERMGPQPMTLLVLSSGMILHQPGLVAIDANDGGFDVVQDVKVVIFNGGHRRSFRSITVASTIIFPPCVWHKRKKGKCWPALVTLSPCALQSGYN